MKHILVVDDNKTNLMAAKNVLNDIYKVTAVTMGAQALKFLSTNTCDLILLDIDMPEMDGYEVMHKVKEDERCQNIPIVFLTGNSDPKTESRCLEEGAIDFIAKPFVPSVMLSRIARILELEEYRKQLSDRLEEKTQEVSEMKTKSLKDALTGLWNRAYTEEQANEFMAGGGHGALFMIDMDNFKAINDNYGHLAGDSTLKMFADTLNKYATENDIVCRIGGDEFVLYIKDCVSNEELATRARDIIADLCVKIDECKYDTNTSVSIGIAQCPEDGSDFASLYNAADKALYYVKQNGKNSYHFYSEQKRIERERTDNSVDLDYLKEIMSRNDAGNGAYLLEYESFQHVYNFIRRFVERSGGDVQTLLFTAKTNDASTIDVADMENAIEMFEQAIFNSLRRVDVSTRYSGKQVIVILFGADIKNGDMVATRILDNYHKMYDIPKVDFEYAIARMEK